MSIQQFRDMAINMKLKFVNAFSILFKRIGGSAQDENEDEAEGEDEDEDGDDEEFIMLLPDYDVNSTQFDLMLIIVYLIFKFEFGENSLIFSRLPAGSMTLNDGHLSSLYINLTTPCVSWLVSTILTTLSPRISSGYTGVYKKIHRVCQFRMQNLSLE